MKIYIAAFYSNLPDPDYKAFRERADAIKWVKNKVWEMVDQQAQQDNERSDGSFLTRWDPRAFYGIVTPADLISPKETKASHE